MKRKLTLFIVTAVLACYGTAEVKAVEVENQEAYKLEVPEMKPELPTSTELTLMSTVAPESNMEMNANHLTGIKVRKVEARLRLLQVKDQCGSKTL